MRTTTEIYKEIRVHQDAILDLKVELKKVRLDAFLKEAGVPDGARPIFAHKETGERVLVSDFPSGDISPNGYLFKKDGTLSNNIKRSVWKTQYTFVGEAILPLPDLLF